MKASARHFKAESRETLVNKDARCYAACVGELLSRFHGGMVGFDKI